MIGHDYRFYIISGVYTEIEFLEMRLSLCLSIPRTLSLGTVKQVFLLLILEMYQTFSFLFCKILLMNLWDNCMKQKAVEVNTALPLLSLLKYWTFFWVLVPEGLYFFLELFNFRFFSITVGA